MFLVISSDNSFDPFAALQGVSKKTLPFQIQINYNVL